MKAVGVKTGRKTFLKNVKRSRWLYLIFALPFLYFIVFKYGAMVWLVIAFEDFKAFKGVFGSKWVGLKWFKAFINDPYFWNIVKNTIVLNLWSIVICFPAPILLALLINEVKCRAFKKFTQTVSYLPYFLSTVVVCGFITNIVASDGLINQLLKAMGMETVTFLMEPGWFRPIYVLSELWQGCGWGSIIYLAALAGVDQQLYEAASIDGASKLQQLLHISLPGIVSVISIQFLLTIGRILSIGYEKIILLYNGATYETADVISTYVYRKGLVEFSFSYSTAVGLFNSLINLALVVAANQLSKRFAGESLF